MYRKNSFACNNKHCYYDPFFFLFYIFRSTYTRFESLNLLHVINSYLRAHDVDQILWDSGLYYRHLHSAAFREYRDFPFYVI